jgi:hypothetical protein
MEVQGQITSLITLMSIISVITMGILILYGKWIWDLNKKVSTSVNGPDCEQRNENHYKDAKELRLEVKADFREMSENMTNEMEKVSKRFAEGMSRLGKEREVSIGALKEQLGIYNNMVLANSKANVEQHQENFKLLVDALKEIGCHMVPGKEK